MTKERPPHKATSELGRTYGFTEREALFKRVSDERFQRILSDEQTRIHTITEDYNN